MFTTTSTSLASPSSIARLDGSAIDVKTEGSPRRSTSGRGWR